MSCEYLNFKSARFYLKSAHLNVELAHLYLMSPHLNSSWLKRFRKFKRLIFFQLNRLVRYSLSLSLSLLMYCWSEVLSAGSEAPSAGSEALWDSLGALAARSEALSAGSKVLKANFEVLSVGFKEPRASQLTLWRQGPHSGHGGPTSWLQAGSWHRGSPSWIGGPPSLIRSPFRRLGKDQKSLQGRCPTSIKLT